MSDHESKIKVKKSAPPADAIPDMGLILQSRAAHWQTEAEPGLKYCAQVIMSQSAYKMLLRQASLHYDHAHGGYLVGRTTLHNDERYVIVEHILSADVAAAESARDRFDFTSEIQKALQARQGVFFPQKRVVGWYRIAPTQTQLDAGEWDLEMHRNFFNHHGHYQVGLLLIPSIENKGFLGLGSEISLDVEGGFLIWEKAGDQRTLDGAHLAGFIEMSDVQTPPLVAWRNLQEV